MYSVETNNHYPTTRLYSGGRELDQLKLDLIEVSANNTLFFRGIEQIRRIKVQLGLLEYTSIIIVPIVYLSRVSAVHNKYI